MAAVISPTTAFAQVNGSGAVSGSGSVTVPADASAAVLFWGMWNNNAGHTIQSASVGGSAFSFPSQKGDGTPTDAPGVGVGVVAVPGTGSQTFAWQWTGGTTRQEGGAIFLVWIKDANTSDLYRDAATDHNTSTTDVGVTVSSATTDLVVVMGMGYDNPNDVTITGGTILTGGNAIKLNSETYDLATVTAGASSTTIAMTSEFYSGMAAISLKEIGGGGGGSTAKPLSALGVG